MPLTPDQLEALAGQPKMVTVDGLAATAAAPAEQFAFLDRAQAERAIANSKPAMRMFKLIPPGSIRGWSGTRRY